MWQSQHRATCVVSLFCLSLLGPGVASRGYAAPPRSAGDVISHCEDRSSERALQSGSDDPCTSRWSEKMQEQYRAPGDTTPWESFRWGPSEFSESELDLLYRPGERRPLWGY